VVDDRGSGREKVGVWGEPQKVAVKVDEVTLRERVRERGGGGERETKVIEREG